MWTNCFLYLPNKKEDFQLAMGVDVLLPHNLDFHNIKADFVALTTTNNNNSDDSFEPITDQY